MAATPSNIVTVLYDTDGRVWGVYNSSMLLKSMLDTMTEILPDKGFVTKNVYMNTNTCADDRPRAAPRSPGADEPKCVLREFDRIREMHEQFVSTQRSLETLRERGAPVPAFLQEEHRLFQEIERKGVPQDERFGHYRTLKLLGIDP